MDLNSQELTNAISYIALVVSASVFFCYLRDRRNAKFAIENEYCNQLLTWHGAVVRVLIELCVISSHATKEKKQPLLITLSALIEQGRFYFPNIAPEAYGLEKPPAYRGYRNVALDFLVASHNLHKKPHDTHLENHAQHLQRLFTSVVFQIVRPAERLLTIRQLTDKYFIQNLSAEDLENDEALNAVSHMWDEKYESK